MPDDSCPLYLLIIILALVMLLNSLVVASKRALDYIDRNYIKDSLEDDPDNKALKSVTRFISKPSAYHYADHAASILCLLVSFALFNLAVYQKLQLPALIGANLGFYIIYTALSDILPKKIAAQSSESTGIRLIGCQKFIYYVRLTPGWISNDIANIYIMNVG